MAHDARGAARGCGGEVRRLVIHTDRGPFIYLISGRRWYPYVPHVEDVHVEDFRALAYQPRFLGHAGSGYSPIGHMVFGARYLEEQGANAATVREFLGHDIHEAYPPGDVPAPCKRGDHPAAVALCAWEAEVAAVAREALELPQVMSAAVKRTDLVMLATEVRDLNPLWSGFDWPALPEPWERPIEVLSPEDAWNQWHSAWKRVGGRS